MKGTEIQSTTEIVKLAEDKKCIWHDGLGTRIPAAVIQNWQLIVVIRALRKGLLYTYVKREKKEFYENVKQYPKTPDECYDSKWFPKTLEEVVDNILETLSYKDKEIIVKNDTMLHHGFGTNVRNNYNLWNLKEENLDLYKYCCSIGLIHADDISMIITSWLKAKIMNVDYDFKYELITSWNHWEKYDKDLLPPNIEGISEEYLKLYKESR